MRDPVVREGEEPGVGEDDLGRAVGGRVAGLDGLRVLRQLLVDLRQARVERAGELLGRGRELVAERLQDRDQRPAAGLELGVDAGRGPGRLAAVGEEQADDARRRTRPRGRGPGAVGTGRPRPRRCGRRGWRGRPGGPRRASGDGLRREDMGGTGAGWGGGRGSAVGRGAGVEARGAGDGAGGSGAGGARRREGQAASTPPGTRAGEPEGRHGATMPGEPGPRQPAPAIRAAVRWASAISDSIGLTPGAVGRAEASVTHRPRTPWTWPSGSATLDRGSVPIRHDAQLVGRRTGAPGWG